MPRPGSETFARAWYAERLSTMDVGEAAGRRVPGEPVVILI